MTTHQAANCVRKVIFLPGSMCPKSGIRPGSPDKRLSLGWANIYGDAPDIARRSGHLNSPGKRRGTTYNPVVALSCDRREHFTLCRGILPGSFWGRRENDLYKFMATKPRARKTAGARGEIQDATSSHVISTKETRDGSPSRGKSKLL